MTTTINRDRANETQIIGFLDGYRDDISPIPYNLIKYFSIRIEWPEKKSMNVYPLEEILEIYTAEEIESGFRGNLDGNAWFSLVGRSREVYNWEHALRNILNTHTLNN
jgi:hypothetical protein